MKLARTSLLFRELPNITKNQLYFDNLRAEFARYARRFYLSGSRHYW
jgi:hypothetical protein